MRPDDLEVVVDRALKQLPGPRAPRTLLPRVMAAIETQKVRPSSARPWLSWPLAWQVASVAAFIVLGVGIARLWPGAQSVVQQSASPAVSSIATFVVEAASKASAVANVVRIVWHALLEPLVGYVLVLVLVMCAACATFGAALGRVALGGVSQT